MPRPSVNELPRASFEPLAPVLPPPRRRQLALNRPARGVVATLEILLAVALGFAVAWAWSRAAVPFQLPASDNPAVPETVERWSGPWIGAAFGFAALAGVLLLDAVRQVLLAVRIAAAPAPGQAYGPAGLPGQPYAQPYDQPYTQPYDQPYAAGHAGGPTEPAPAPPPQPWQTAEHDPQGPDQVR
jgi:hypothetical protein